MKRFHIIKIYAGSPIWHNGNTFHRVYSSSQLAGTYSLISLAFTLPAGDGITRGTVDGVEAEPPAVDATFDRVQGVVLDPDGRLPDIGFPVVGAELPDATPIEFEPLAELAVVLLHAPAADPVEEPGLTTEAGLRRSPRLPRREGICALA